MTVGEYIYNLYPQNGYYVDIGAYDGITNDETLFLEQHGWDGICIEGHPIIFERLKINRKAKTYNAFVGKQSTRQTICLPVWSLGSTIVDNVPNDHLEFLKTQGNYTINETKIVELESILDELGAPKTIELLKSDTEGNCLEILKTLSYEKYHFKVISVELGLPGVPNTKFEEGVEFLKTKNYQYIKSFNQNDLFIHDSYIIK